MKDLNQLLSNLSPQLNPGEYVYVQLDEDRINLDCLMKFQEEEGVTVIVKRELADEINLPYSYVCSWITLKVNSSLESVGLTAAFSNALTRHSISCNVVAAHSHDHIFVNTKDAERAMDVLNQLSEQNS